MALFIEKLDLPKEPIELTINPDGTVEYSTWEIDQDGGEHEVVHKTKAVELSIKELG